MKITTRILSIIFVLALLAGCASAPTALPTATTTPPPISTSRPLPTFTNTPEPEPTPTAKIEIPLEMQSVTIEAAKEFANAMTAAGTPITFEEVLGQGLVLEQGGKDGNKFEVAKTQDGYPIMIKMEGEWKMALKDLSLFPSPRFIGIDLEGDTANNQAVDAIVKREFNIITLEAFSWKYMEPTEGVNDQGYESWRSGLIRKWDDKGKTLQGHALLWPEKNPDWLTSKSKEDLEIVLRAHIQSVIKKYPQIDTWTVVNEPYLSAPQYNYVRQDIFYEKLGDEAYVIAFQEAYKANPQATLVLNDTLNHSSTGKNSMTTARTHEILTLIKEGLPVEAKIMVGAQFHLDATDLPNEEDVVQTLLAYQKEGVTVGLTEVDVDMSGISGNETTRLVVSHYETNG